MPQAAFKKNSQTAAPDSVERREREKGQQSKVQLLLMMSEGRERKTFWPLTYEMFMIQEIGWQKTKDRAQPSKKNVVYFSHAK